MAEVIKVEVGRTYRSGNKAALDAYRNSHRAGSTVRAETTSPSTTPPVAASSLTAPPLITPPVATIPAVPQIRERLKVAAYCRVSTLLDSQETSIEAQRQHYEAEIKSNPDWEFAGVYLEAGVSGTKTEIRPELQRLIADCKEGRINLILTKSISRFSRNTSDCLEMVRTLTALGVTIRFAKENIDTGTMESEFMLSILACLAEDESHSISGNMKWSIRKKFEAGTYKMRLPPYGYEWRGDELVVVPEQAEVVRRIFALTLSGNGAVTIARTLNADRIPSPAGKAWTSTTIRKIISNPVYKGDMLCQKTYMDEHFIQRPNNGELDQFLDAGHHEGIITPEDFDNAQAAVSQRAKEVGYRPGANNAGRSANRYCFSSMLTCKACGSVMHRQGWNGAGNCWICHRHATHPDLCSMKPQSEEDLKRAFINCLNKLAWAQTSADPAVRLLDVYEGMLGVTEDNAARLAEIDRLLAENDRENRRLTAIVMRERFLPEHRERKMALSTQAKELVSEKNRILISGGPAGTLQQLKSFVAGWKITDNPEAFSPEAFTEFIEGCVVNSGKMVTFHFRCGLKLTESLYKCELCDRKTSGKGAE